MGIGDIFKASDNKRLQEENYYLKQENEKLKAMLTPEMQDAEHIKELVSYLNSQKESLNSEISNLSQQIQILKSDIESKRNEIINLDEEIMIQSFGIYKPTYNFLNSAKYKQKLEEIRTRQKMMIKDGTAINGNMDWTVNGSVQQGRKMVKDMQKLLLRAFNGECDELVSKVKYNNYETYLKRVGSSYEAITKLGRIMNLSISCEYYRLKCDELTLAFEYAQKVQQEKEDQKAIREQMKEEAKLQKEIDEARKRLEKEQNHYENALHKVQQQLQTATDDKREELEKKIKNIEAQLEDNQKAMKDVDYRQANQRAGYVYIISNIGSFGEDVYKIGMTRRLDPQERVDELGSASVPFKFDVHAIIFSDDAPSLENALHHAFANQRLNWVNNRKEFFRVTLDEIKKVVYQNFDKTVAFIDIPEAEQFRVSEKMKIESLGANYQPSGIKIPVISIEPEIPSAADTIQSEISSGKYPEIENILKKHYGENIKIECQEKPNAYYIEAYENGVKTVRSRVYQREMNPYDIAFFRSDGSTIKLAFFNELSELDNFIDDIKAECAVK